MEPYNPNQSELQFVLRGGIRGELGQFQQVGLGKERNEVCCSMRFL